MSPALCECGDARHSRIDAAPAAQSARSIVELPRVGVRGKFLWAGGRKLPIRGVTYGPFRPDSAGCEYGRPERVEDDFRRMRAHGFNAVRTYTVPPPWLLDCAQRHGLRVMVGLPWEQHVTFLDSRLIRRRILTAVRGAVRSCHAHPAILAYAIGNEIPAPIVRWHGRRAIEDFLRELYLTAKAQDEQTLVTYVNYPSTEYLQLPFVDFACFNVYLETQSKLAAYLQRLHNLVDEMPLVMAEIGLDSLRNGLERQADTLDWQVRTVLRSGCAGAFMFSWTDEWHRGGHDIEDWDFGLTTRDRTTKPALSSVSSAFEEGLTPPNRRWPRVSVVVCTYNGAKTIRECLAGLMRLDYPDFQVIVVNDGSTDGTADIVRQFDVTQIDTPNNGLSHARNLGMRAADGEIVAYIDDDAWPDPDWLKHLACLFESSDYVGIGGPNLAPPGDGPIAECVAHAPGGPNHVLLTDFVAEHIPGCNMAFRRSALEAIDGFDTQFRIAGDDVDLCWRLQDAGGTLGFAPGAMVWHHRRGSVRAYLKQQRNYGRAEAMLERKWPHRYNAAGHVPWRGQLYGKGPTRPLYLRRHRVYHGVWGTGLFQSLYTRPAGVLQWLPLMPEWYLIVVVLLAVAALSVVWQPLVIGVPLLAIAVGVPLVQAVQSAMHESLGRETQSAVGRVGQRALTTFLHLAQPAVRLWGRLSYGLTPWRRGGCDRLVLPIPRTQAIWDEQWASQEERLSRLNHALCARRLRTKAGGDFDRWDLDVRGGILGGVRARMTIEEHGGGRQLVRVRRWPTLSAGAWALVWITGAIALLAGLAGQVAPCVIFGCLWLVVCLMAMADCAGASASLLDVLPSAGSTSHPVEADAPAETERRSKPMSQVEAQVT